LVEFALISPILFLILFAILEFGWTFSQVLDTKHGVREAARLAAVNYQPTVDEGTVQTDEIVAEICRRLDEPSASRVVLTLDTSDSSVGSLATVRVERDLEQITGFFSSMLDGYDPASEVSFRLERDVTWTATVGEQSCPTV
jgi:Flp pilus assembly protein TadG